MKPVLLALTGLVALSVSASSQRPEVPPNPFVSAPAAAAAATTESIGNSKIIKMHAAGLGDDVIVSMINNQPGVYTTTVDDMIALKGAGISDKVLGAMIAKNSTPTSLVVASAETQPSTTAAPSTAPSVSDKPRVFLQSVSHGNNQNSARDQSMEMSRDFERDCPGVRISINQQVADYTVVLNHIEIGLFIRDNQFQIADKNGDLISKTKEGGSIAGGVKKACQFILTNWTNTPR